MSEHEQERIKEHTHLAEIIAIAQNQLAAAQGSSQETQQAILEASREMREDSARGLSSLYSTQSFQDLVSLNQYALSLSMKQAAHEMEQGRVKVLQRMIDAPYFARIDITFDDEDAPEQIYIGRSTLKDEQSYEIYVYDWRTPIASVFYRFGAGKVYYDAPMGRVTGELCLKRQYEIKCGKLEYFFDADVEIADAFLRNLLSKNASPRMTAIVETIQKDQDMAIRDMQHELIMVQGVAGSGKTSIALHRVAYLMYQGLSSPLSAGNIIILSPNTLFQRYISNVLLELGENSVTSVTFEQLYTKILDGAPLQSGSERFELMNTLQDSPRKAIMKASAAFKVSSQFVAVLNRFIDDLPRRWIEFSDVYYAGQVIATRQRLKARILKGSTMPIGRRLSRIEQSLWDRIHERRDARMRKLEGYVRHCPGHMLEVEAFARQYSIHECTVLRRQIQRFTKLDCRTLYTKLFLDERYFYQLAEGMELPVCTEDILHHTQEALMSPLLSYEDAAAIAYLRLRVDGCNDHHDIRQVVVDEAQDYDPLHFEALNLLFPRARFTVLGDIHQALGKRADMTLYDQFSRILNRRTSALIQLNKSFRCTSEILACSMRFLESGEEIESFNRKGDVPRVHEAPSEQALSEAIVQEIMRCREQGYQSTALITKTLGDAKRWHERLKNTVEVHLIQSDGLVEPSGTFLIPLALSKGLEFDAVLVLDCDRTHYHSEEDKNLLYVACTRALHSLNLFYWGEPSPLL